MAMDVIIIENLVSKRLAVHVKIVCARMPFMARVLINVDLPEAFEPVIRLLLSIKWVLVTGFGISG